MLYNITDFINNTTKISFAIPSYYYQGYSKNGELLKLPRTILAENIAQGLMQQLQEDEIYAREGKMYGILLVELPDGEQKVIKAFSGLLNGNSVVPGWVEPIPKSSDIMLQEQATLTRLAEIKQEIIRLQEIPAREEYQKLLLGFSEQLKVMNLQHLENKKLRDQQRKILSTKLTDLALETALEILANQSRRDGIKLRNFKSEQNQVLQPLREVIATADEQISCLKQKRKELSRELQKQMHATYYLTNFYGQSQPLQDLFPSGLPTGTGECCAPKLLHYAAIHHLKPVAMAEFWWGIYDEVNDRIPGKFYGACVERCQPIMGFMLSGLSRERLKVNLDIIYEDQWLIAINKPPGLLSVPGRYCYNQDSVVSRLSSFYNQDFFAVHRLDQDTSGILLLAKDRVTYSQFSQLFARREIQKVYEAILAGLLTINQGTINLPLWGDPEHRPYQKVDWERGKQSITHFRVVTRENSYTLVEFIPITGRTHQLRVHAADVQGLNMTILGDRLYGCHENVSRLYLHAKKLVFQHPYLQTTINLEIKTPF
ncbi:RluA family pseudouridine synthase [Anabaena sp. FACHB-1237]|uniref:RluA family pseudouridine synthase n=1 Tax=Anabaena sp. FACHB-1237 TaxID=2692769 RepID=UPI0016806A3C|nr:RluA family pseudouridine synthase [Anabaena sp. FACHB-1237]MBD2136469.1 RluA family pseudouridine synthase [Anabaena sp. FACHB-1237]